MTVFAPKEKNTGAAVVVFPGEGYQILTIDIEWTEVCDWLPSRGISCVLLKYRVPGAGLRPRSGPYPRSPMALEDAQRTVGLLAGKNPLNISGILQTVLSYGGLGRQCGGFSAIDIALPER